MLILRSDTCLMLSILFLGYLSPREGLSGPGVRGYCCCPLNVFSTRWIDHVNLPSGLGVQGGEFTYVLQPFDWQLWVRSDHHCPSLWVTAVGPRWSSLPLPLSDSCGSEVIIIAPPTEGSKQCPRLGSTCWATQNKGQGLDISPLFLSHILFWGGEMEKRILELTTKDKKISAWEI